MARPTSFHCSGLFYDSYDFIQTNSRLPQENHIKKTPRAKLAPGALRVIQRNYIGWTFAAAGPFLPCSISKRIR